MAVARLLRLVPRRCPWFADVPAHNLGIDLEKGTLDILGEGEAHLSGRRRRCRRRRAAAPRPCLQSAPLRRQLGAQLRSVSSSASNAAQMRSHNSANQATLWAFLCSVVSLSLTSPPGFDADTQLWHARCPGRGVIPGYIPGQPLRIEAHRPRPIGVAKRDPG